MANGRLGQVVWHLRHLVGGPTSAGVSDGQLLERFALAGEEAAFDAIMRRHGRMVLGVCRRVLHNENDVEDTFQATFLLLVRKARLIRKRESVGSWLHGVAYRLAVRSKAEDIRRRVHEHREIKRVAPEPAYVAAWRELQDVLDEELQRLPEKYRLPLVLCYLEGETQEEVAQRLGWPVGTVKGRVARARELLRSRLERRGLTLGAAPLATLLAVHTTSAAVPASLAAVAAQSAWAMASGQLATGIPLRVVALAEGLARAWFIAKLKLAGALLLTASLLATGVGLVALSQRTPGLDEPAKPDALAPAVAVALSPASAPKPAPGDVLGDPLPDGVVARMGTTRLRAGRPLYGITFSPHGKSVAAPGEDAVIVWDTATGKELRRFQGHEGRVFPVAFSPDGEKLATGGADKTVRVWDVAAGTELRRFEGHTGPVAGLVISPDGKTLVSGALDKTVRVWDMASGEEVRRLERSTEPPLDHLPNAFLPDNRTVVTLDQKNAVYLWDVTTGNELHHLDAKLEPYDRVALSPDGTLFAAAVRGKSSVRRWDVASGNELAPYEGHRGEIRSFAFSPDGKTLATSGADRTLRLWDAATGVEQHRLEVDRSQNEGLAFSPDGRLLATGQDGTIRLWDIESGREVQPFDAHQSQVRMVGCTPDGKSVISGGRDNTLGWWDPTTGRLATHWRGEQGSYVAPIALTADVGTVACGGNIDGVISLRDARTGVERVALRGHKGLTTSVDVIFVAFAPDGRTMLSGGFDRTVRLWEIANGRELRQFPGELPQVSAVAYSPCGHVVAAGGLNGAVHSWDVNSGDVLHRCAGHSDAVRALAFSPDGRTLAAAHGRHFSGGEGVVNLWNVTDGSLYRQLSGHSIRTQAVAFSPNGKLLATAGADCKIRLWDPNTGLELAVLDGHRGAVVSIAFAPGGRHLVSGSLDTTVLVWPVHDSISANASRTKLSGSSE